MHSNRVQDNGDIGLKSFKEKCATYYSCRKRPTDCARLLANLHSRLTATRCKRSAAPTLGLRQVTAVALIDSWRAQLFWVLQIKPVYRFLHCYGGAAGLQAVVFVPRRRAKQRHNAVPHYLGHRAVIPVNSFDHLLKHTIKSDCPPDLGQPRAPLSPSDLQTGWSEPCARPRVVSGSASLLRAAAKAVLSRERRS